MSKEPDGRIESLIGISPRRLAILEEKAKFFDMSEESRQVAGMLCLDIDILAEVATNADMDVDRLRKHIARLKDGKDNILNDPAARAKRYAAVQMLIDCGALGPDSRTESAPTQNDTPEP